jgi:hypothetical protein
MEHCTEAGSGLPWPVIVFAALCGCAMLFLIAQVFNPRFEHWVHGCIMFDVVWLPYPNGYWNELERENEQIERAWREWHGLTSLEPAPTKVIPSRYMACSHCNKPSRKHSKPVPPRAEGSAS